MRPTGWILAGVVSGVLFIMAGGLAFFGVTIVSRAFGDNYDNLDINYFGASAMFFILALVLAYGGVVILLAQRSVSRINDPRRR